jgi:hypothetical protein
VKVLINYANDIFLRSQKLNSKTGLEVAGFDQVVSFSPRDIDLSFHSANQEVLIQKRGNGYWLWKPYFIKRMLDEVKTGDYIFYSDSGAYFLQSINPLIEASAESRQDLICFELHGHVESDWTKRDAFVLMGCDSPTYASTMQRQAGFSLWRKSKFTLDFIEEYLIFAQDPRILTDIDNQCGLDNYPGFRDHRHDQSILSLLSKKHGLIAYRDPSQWGDSVIAAYPNSSYGRLIEHTRDRDQAIS